MSEGRDLMARVYVQTEILSNIIHSRKKKKNNGINVGNFLLAVITEAIREKLDKKDRVLDEDDDILIELTFKTKLREEKKDGKK